MTRSTTVEVPPRTHGHVDGLHHALAVTLPVFGVEDVAPVTHWSSGRLSGDAASMVRAAACAACRRND